MADTSKEPNLLKHRDVKNAILENSGKKSEVGVVPSFPEFIDYVIKETKDLSSPRDWKGVMTWKSYFSKCLPCDVKYDVIMKLETHKEDEKWLINTRNLTLLSRVRDWRHLSSDKNIRKNLISQLSKVRRVINKIPVVHPLLVYFGGVVLDIVLVTWEKHPSLDLDQEFKKNLNMFLAWGIKQINFILHTLISIVSKLIKLCIRL